MIQCLRKNNTKIMTLALTIAPKHDLAVVPDTVEHMPVAQHLGGVAAANQRPAISHNQYVARGIVDASRMQAELLARAYFK